MEKGKNIGHWRWMLRIMGWWYIPLIGYVRPRLEKLDMEEAVVAIRLRRRTKNHLKSMYFGALAVGADVAAGLHAFYFSDELGVKPSFAFRSVKAEFLKRATGTVRFVSKDGRLVRSLVLDAKSSGERRNAIVKVEAFVGEEPVAVFDMEISVKVI